jgi:2-polyprenyl-3-methyl-5-hydroxy-6-metoxy-1,4-benzoquinol methylase
VLDLATRDLSPEILDLPGTSAERHRAALAGLARVNAVSRTSKQAWGEIKRLALARGLSTVSVLDIGCGGGDVPLDVQRRALRAGLNMNITGYDLSPTVVEYARAQAAKAMHKHRGETDVRRRRADFEVRDVFLDRPEHRFDVVMCSLLMHHLDHARAATLLETMADTASKLVLVNDLVRSRLGYVAAKVALHLLSRSDIVHADGPHSVARAFRVEELQRLVDEVGMVGAQIRTIWPFRMLLTWEPRGVRRRSEPRPAALGETQTISPTAA